jgi:uncharacterized protein with NRDE domain
VCTLALYFGLFEDYPLIAAANRDERYDRPSAAPSLQGSNPTILAGKDLLAGGTWLGVNEYGLLVGILNRRLNSDPVSHSNSRSRGLLCLDLLRLKSAADGHEFIQGHEAVYQPFTVLFADSREAWTAYNSEREIKAHRLEPGLHVFSNTGEPDTRSGKLHRAYRRFEQLSDGVTANGGDTKYWLESLAAVLGDHTLGNGVADAREAICVHDDVSGTVSSSIIFYSQSQKRFYGHYSPGAPCRTPFGAPLALDVR